MKLNDSEGEGTDDDENKRKQEMALKIQAIQPPIGMTARYSPKGLRYRFYYPEF
jgi:hypothetical protein